MIPSAVSSLTLGDMSSGPQPIWANCIAMYQMVKPCKPVALLDHVDPRGTSADASSCPAFAFLCHCLVAADRSHQLLVHLKVRIA